MKNHLLQFTKLKNRFIALRHGMSEANELGIISCSPNNNSGFKHGLNSYGIEQASKSHLGLQEVVPNIDTYINTNKFHLYSSDFKRTQMTSEGLCHGLQLIPEKTIQLTSLLRERSFGNLDLLEDDINYQRVWEADDQALDATGGLDTVESVMSVLHRSTKCVAELEKKYDNSLIVIVGHGDLLQILQTGFLKIDPRQHRTLDHLNQCEFRELYLKE
jgi:broad specificity phosphatase PhoE